jgi:hypothetical protein
MNQPREREADSQSKHPYPRTSNKRDAIPVECFGLVRHHLQIFDVNVVPLNAASRLALWDKLNQFAFGAQAFVFALRCSSLREG